MPEPSNSSNAHKEWDRQVLAFSSSEVRSNEREYIAAICKNRDIFCRCNDGKGTRYKRVHVVKFQLYEVEKQVKLIYGDRQKGMGRQLLR